MENKTGSKTAISGAVFLMATSAIGPGFITQTAKFTEALGASFGFVILISVLIDLGAQLNIWLILGVSRLYAHELANRVFRGTGFALSTLVILGGLAFNIGNIAGAGLGLQVLTGCSVKTGALISAGIAIMLFLLKKAGSAMDHFTRMLGLVMIGLTLFVLFQTTPPLDQVLTNSFVPDRIDEMVILTIVGGTVGGYISFAGIHRLLEAGVSGSENIRRITRGSVSGILVASAMRVILFLAAFGVIWQGTRLGNTNPAATVFTTAAGNIGYKLFGLVFWSAAITSVVGSAYTSITFARQLHPSVSNFFRQAIIVFILFSTLVFMILGQPVKILVAAGAVNGLVLPTGLALVLLAARRKHIMSDYSHPGWLWFTGWLVVLAMSWLAIKTISNYV